MSAPAVRFTRAQFRQALLDRGVDPSTVPEPECGFETEEEDGDEAVDAGAGSRSLLDGDGDEVRPGQAGGGADARDEAVRARSHGRGPVTAGGTEKGGGDAREANAVVDTAPPSSPTTTAAGSRAAAARVEVAEHADERAPAPVAGGIDETHGRPDDGAWRHLNLASSLPDQQQAAPTPPSAAQHVAALASLDAFTFGAVVHDRGSTAVEEAVAYAAMRVALYLDGRNGDEWPGRTQYAPGDSVAGRAHSAGATLARFLHLAIDAVTRATTLPVHLDETPARFNTLIAAGLRQSSASAAAERGSGGDFDVFRSDVARALATLGEVGKVYASCGSYACDAAVAHLREMRQWSSPWMLSNIVAASTALFVRTAQRCTLMLGAGSLPSTGACRHGEAEIVTHDVADRLVCARATMLSVLATSQLYASAAPYDSTGTRQAASAVSYVLIASCGALRGVLEQKGGDMPVDQISAVRLLQRHFDHDGARGPAQATSRTSPGGAHARRATLDTLSS